MTNPDYWQRWKGETVAILASGPSMTRADAVLVERSGCKTITVNSTWRLHPRADAHYSSDEDWWVENLPDMRHQTFGEFWSGAPGRVAHDVRSCPYRKAAMGLHRAPGAIAWGGNSGYCAIGLAYQFGAAKIILLGFDQQGDHWHEDHPLHVKRPANFPMWADRFATLARDCRKHGLDVVNCSRETALTCFRRGRLEGEIG